MDISILCSILLLGVIGLIYLKMKNSWQEYDKGLRDGKNDLFPRSNNAWYSRGWKAGLSEVSKSKVFIGDKFKSVAGAVNSGSTGLKSDSNGKVYQYYQLITDGDLSGMYRPIFTFGQTEYRNELRERELADIINSGFHVYVIDPKGS